MYGNLHKFGNKLHIFYTNVYKSFTDSSIQVQPLMFSTGTKSNINYWILHIILTILLHILYQFA